MDATTLQSSSTLNSYQSTMSCMGNPQAIIRKCVHPSMPHSNFYSLGTELRFQNAKCRKYVSDFLKILNQQNFFARGDKYCMSVNLASHFFMSNRLPQNLGTFLEIYRSASGLYEFAIPNCCS